MGDWRTRTSGVTQTITFKADGTVFGDAGCNRFTGTYTTDGDSITIGPLATTLMACEQSVMDAEQTFLVRLQAAVSYRAKAAHAADLRSEGPHPVRRTLTERHGGSVTALPSMLGVLRHPAILHHWASSCTAMGRAVVKLCT